MSFGSNLILALLFFTTALAAAPAAPASTPEAWATLFAQAGQRCTAASGLLDATANAQPVDFQDEVLVLVGGMWPQPHMKQASAHLLCRYSKSNGSVKLIELPPDWRRQLVR